MRAVLERDYVAESARARGFAARTLLGAFGALAILFAVLGKEFTGGDYDRAGALVFSALGRALFAFLAVTTPMLLVGSLLPERQRNTLEILMATPEGPRGVAAGKFVARLGTALTWAAAALPPLTVAVLFGGTSWRQLVNLAAALLGTALELGGWGLLVSAAARRIATAAFLAYLLPAAHWGWEFAVRGPSSAPAGPLFVRATTPFPSLDLGGWDGDIQPLAGTEAFDLLRWPGLWHLLVGAAVAAAALPGAAALLSLERAAPDIRLRLPRIRGEGALRAWLTRGNPVAWKESLLLNTAWSRSLYYLVLALLVAGEVAFLVMDGMGRWDASRDFLYLTGVVSVITAMAALQGAASMATEKAQGTFELLRITRLTPREIARGKFLGTALSIAVLLLVPLSHLAVAAATGLYHPVTALLGTAAALLMAANFAAHGLTWGAVARTPGTALAGAAAFVAFAATNCSVLCFIPFVLAGLRLFRKDASTEFFEIVVIPGVLCGGPLMILHPLLQALDRSARGSGGADLLSAGASAVLACLCLLVTVLYLVYRWHRLPEVLEREMARLTEEGEGGPLPPRRAAAPPPVADHLSAAARRVRDRSLGKGKHP